MNKEKEAKAILNKVAKWNRRPYCDSDDVEVEV